MTDPFQFKVDDIPDPIYEPISSLSFITQDPSFHNEVQEALEQNFYYTCLCNDVLGLLNDIENSPASFFALRAIQGNNKIEWSSNGSDHYHLQLSEYSFSHHHYVGRYLRFIKRSAGKGSPEHGTTLSASVKRSEEKYTKDVEAVLASLFSEAEVMVLSDTPLEGLTKSGRVWKRINCQIKNYKILSHTDLSPFTVNEILSDDLEDFYEYLSLLHFNGYPYFKDSHVAATTSYLHSIEGGNKAEPGELYLISLTQISPIVLFKLIQKELCLTAQATTKDISILSYYNGAHLYTWKVSRT